MKKIGILTYWGVPNYGAWMQAYALNNVVREIAQDEDEVHHIDYLSDVHWNAYYKKDIQLENAFSYSWDEIIHSFKMTVSDLEKQYYDIVILGSDAIWEFSHDDMGNDIHLVGQNINAKKISSYAASFGETKMEELENWVINGISKLDLITIRDQYSKTIVDSLIENRKSQLVLDPSLLYDFQNDKKIKEPRYKKYIAVYGVRFDDEFINETICFARENNLELISIGYINSWCDRSIKMLELRTFEWLGFIKNADYVATSMFHGLMLSISFNKQVRFDQVEYVKNRSQTLLEQLSIEDCVSNYDVDIDYTKVNCKLQELRKNSIDIIKKIITID